MNFLASMRPGRIRPGKTARVATVLSGKTDWAGFNEAGANPPRKVGGMSDVRESPRQSSRFNGAGANPPGKTHAERIVRRARAFLVLLLQ